MVRRKKQQQQKEGSPDTRTGKRRMHLRTKGTTRRGRRNKRHTRRRVRLLPTHPTLILVPGCTSGSRPSSSSAHNLRTDRSSNRSLTGCRSPHRKTDDQGLESNVVSRVDEEPFGWRSVAEEAGSRIPIDGQGCGEEGQGFRGADPQAAHPFPPPSCCRSSVCVMQCMPASS